ncbi:MAG: hypothetical protein ACRCX2_35175 [Paraclostridium sp.]
MSRIAIIFSSNNDNTVEDIKSFEGLKRRFCEVITQEEIKINPDILKQYAGMLDCTNNHIFYNGSLSRKSGTEFKSGDKTYVKTATNKFIVTGPSIFQLTATKYNKTPNIVESEKKSYDSYNGSLNFLYSLIREINNTLMYEEGIKNEGIVLNEILEKNNSKIYKLVREIPKSKDSNTIYITPEDVRILKEIVALKGVIS